MVLPIWRTFAYEASVPPPADFWRPWPVHLLGSSEEAASDRGGPRLVGTSPTLEITEAGLTPHAGWFQGRWRPEVLRCRMTFRASERQASTAQTASFYVDAGVISRMREGDVLSVVHTACGGNGVSVVRNGCLLVAVGAVTHVPLGSTVEARIPRDVIAEAESLFRRLDSSFEFRELPIELTIAGRKAILPGGSGAFPGYEVSVLRGFHNGTPGVDECVAIAASGSCPGPAANASARLLDADGLEVGSW
jgi:hypothetical protein